MRKLLVLMAILVLAAPLMFYGCSGDDGSTGATGATGATGPTGATGQDLIATAAPESCQICHAGAGDTHQAFYDQLYQDNVIKVTDVASTPTGQVIVTTFKMTKNGANFDCRQADSLGGYFVRWDDATGQFTANQGLTTGSTTGTMTKAYDNAGGCTITATFFDNQTVLNFAEDNGAIVIYGYDEKVASIPNSRVQQEKYPFAGLTVQGTVNYESGANVAGCEKCHTVPFLKHGYIYGRVAGDFATEFYTCKACHVDTRDGGHFIWQELVTDTQRASELWAQAKATGDDPEDFMTDAEKAQFAYKARLMNDVHMSHAMEFEYPTSMATCNYCHEGKLDQVLTDENFVLETCKSCHPVTRPAVEEQRLKDQPSLEEIIPHQWQANTVCNSCHNAGQTGIAPVFNKIHNGYYDLIYAEAGVKYSGAIKVVFDNVSYNDNTYVLSFGFSASGSAGGLNSSNILPTVLVGLYGYDTKDFIVGPHESDAAGKRNLEFTTNTASSSYGRNSPRITVAKTGSAWNVTADLSDWAGIIDNGAVRRVEVAVMPLLQNSEGEAVALDAPSKTYSLVTNNGTFLPNYYQGKAEIAKVVNCNNCHDALATTFHTADRGGNIVVCRLCHITKAGGSHLEMQSRSIDSYAHAIHSFQAFDIGGVDFDNTIESMFYDLKVEAHFPTFGVTNCVACHAATKFNVPDQAKSLPGILSASSKNTTLDRMIYGVPAYVTGPASRACGACHRAEMEKEDLAVELSAFNSHTDKGGYMLLAGATSADQVATLMEAINKILPMYNDGILVVLP